MDYPIWCIGCCYGGGTHTFEIFTDLEEAKEMRRRKLCDPKAIKVLLWEM